MLHEVHSQLDFHSVSGKFLVAYSGGLDSHVLLHLMTEISKSSDFIIRAIHVDHGLQEGSDLWVEHCKKQCDSLDISCEIAELMLQPCKGDSIEALARNARYQVFKDALQADEVLLTAHHQDDQAETLLLQLFRGSGVDGLASMPVIQYFGLGRHLRPLLGFSREELETYSREQCLDYIEDPSNQDERFDRNFLRQNIFPQLQNRWQGLNKVLSRAADIQSETKCLLDEFAGQDLKKIQDNEKDRVSITALLKLSKARQKLVLRYWIKQQGFLAPSSKKFQHLFKDVIHARQDATPLLCWQGAEIRRYQNSLYIMSPLPEHDNLQVIPWDISQVLLIPELGVELQPNLLKPFLQDLNDPVTVRFRQGGEKFKLPERGGSVSLKNLLQEAGIPPWIRSRLPLIYSGESLIYIFGVTKFNK